MSMTPCKRSVTLRGVRRSVDAGVVIVTDILLVMLMVMVVLVLVAVVMIPLQRIQTWLKSYSITFVLTLLYQNGLFSSVNQEVR